jgi:ribonucleotide monophosphatase NagD (HAD superfamily)
MDGVLVREEHALPGAAEFLDCLVERERPFLVLTSSGTRFVPDACWILADAIELV